MKDENTNNIQNKKREKPKQPYLVQQTQKQEQSPTKYLKNMAA
jgi:hypothetical protein